MTGTGRTRPRWMTVLFHLVLGAALLTDLWGTVFWARVGGALGAGIAVVGTVIALFLGLVLLIDVRGQWLSQDGTDDGSSG